MSRPRLLDLYCGAGGAGMGYSLAGFDVIGVDLHPQPRYPFDFVQADALDIEAYAELVGRIDAVHASPPCQAYTRAGALRTNRADHPRLIEPTRALLRALGLPYVIENVPGAPLLDPVQLCGTSFGLGGDGWELQRHRLFETSFHARGTACAHRLPAISIVGHGATKATRERLGRNPRIAEKRAAMGIKWTNRDELSEAIPPAYTNHIGRQLRKELGL